MPFRKTLVDFAPTGGTKLWSGSWTAVGDYRYKKTKKIVESWCTNSRDWWREETPKGIWIKFRVYYKQRISAALL